MKLGIFDSGLGGLIIAKAVFKALPQYDYVYLGDTKNLPYGNKTQSQIFSLTTKALDFLFAQDCKLVIIACNTSSAKALRKVQREFLPKFYPDRKVLGVIVPTVEIVVGQHTRGILAPRKDSPCVGIIATTSTVLSHAYKKEIAKINPQIKVFEQAAPKLVPMIEADDLENINKVLKIYLDPLLQKNISALVLGCTHYPIIKKQIRSLVGNKVKIFSQEEIIPEKLSAYLKKHGEISSVLSKRSQRTFMVTKVNPGFKKVAKRLFGKGIRLVLV